MIESEFHRGMGQKGPGSDVRGRYRWVGNSGPSLVGRRWIVDVDGADVYTVGAIKLDLGEPLLWIGAPRVVCVEECGGEQERVPGGDKDSPERLARLACFEREGPMVCWMVVSAELHFRVQ